jgi:hypothetical protein
LGGNRAAAASASGLAIIGGEMSAALDLGEYLKAKWTAKRHQ